MKSKDGFVQAYNAQAAVDAGAQIIVAHELTGMQSDPLAAATALIVDQQTLGVLNMSTVDSFAAKWLIASGSPGKIILGAPHADPHNLRKLRLCCSSSAFDTLPARKRCLPFPTCDGRAAMRRLNHATAGQGWPGKP
jgi:hypothetical protein